MKKKYKYPLWIQDILYLTHNLNNADFSIYKLGHFYLTLGRPEAIIESLSQIDSNYPIAIEFLSWNDWIKSLFWKSYSKPFNDHGITLPKSRLIYFFLKKKIKHSLFEKPIESEILTSLFSLFHSKNKKNQFVLLGLHGKSARCFIRSIHRFFPQAFVSATIDKKQFYQSPITTSAFISRLDPSVVILNKPFKIKHFSKYFNHSQEPEISSKIKNYKQKFKKKERIKYIKLPNAIYLFSSKAINIYANPPDYETFKLKILSKKIYFIIKKILHSMIKSLVFLIKSIIFVTMTPAHLIGLIYIMVSRLHKIK